MLQGRGVDLTKPAILGVRGYYRDTMGKPGVNDRGIYDDAVFVFACDPERDFKITCHAPFNFNTDPSRVRKGHGTAESTKGMAVLEPGIWLYELGMHRGKYMALIQSEPVKVKRDGIVEDYTDVGMFGINIHKGGIETTSSLGCQTVPPTQWYAFYALVEMLMAQNQIKEIQYCLVDVTK